jgi:hypothetical protein
VELSRRRHLEPIVPRNFRVVLGPQPLAIVLGCGGKCVCQSRRWEKLGSKGQGEGDSNESSLSRWVGVICEIFHLHCAQQAGGDGFGGAALTPSNLYSPSVELTHFLDQPSRKGSKNTTCRGRGVKMCRLVQFGKCSASCSSVLSSCIPAGPLHPTRSGSPPSLRLTHISHPAV